MMVPNSSSSSSTAAAAAQQQLQWLAQKLPQGLAVGGPFTVLPEVSFFHALDLQQQQRGEQQPVSISCHPNPRRASYCRDRRRLSSQLHQQQQQQNPTSKTSGNEQIHKNTTGSDNLLPPQKVEIQQQDQQNQKGKQRKSHHSQQQLIATPFSTSVPVPLPPPSCTGIEIEKPRKTKGHEQKSAVERRNERERTRVHTVNQAFHLLRRLLPCYSHVKKRVSKLKILRATIEYAYAMMDSIDAADALTSAVKSEAGKHRKVENGGGNHKVKNNEKASNGKAPALSIKAIVEPIEDVLQQKDQKQHLVVHNNKNNQSQIAKPSIAPSPMDGTAADGATTLSMQLAVTPPYAIVPPQSSRTPKVSMYQPPSEAPFGAPPSNSFSGAVETSGGTVLGSSTTHSSVVEQQIYGTSSLSIPSVYFSALNQSSSLPSVASASTTAVSWSYWWNHNNNYNNTGISHQQHSAEPVPGLLGQHTISFWPSAAVQMPSHQTSINLSAGSGGTTTTDFLHLMSSSAAAGSATPAYLLETSPPFSGNVATTTSTEGLHQPFQQQQLNLELSASSNSQQQQWHPNSIATIAAQHSSETIPIGAASTVVVPSKEAVVAEEVQQQQLQPLLVHPLPNQPELGVSDVIVATPEATSSSASSNSWLHYPLIAHWYGASLNL